nr:hypothetical protein SOVF_194470 [Ipomoea trifida]
MEAWVGLSISPSLMARTIVQSITVGILWATVITVQSANSVLIVFCRIMSVALSIDAVASSSTKILLFLNIARPRQNNCLCPILQFDPSSKTDETNSFFMLREGVKIVSHCSIEKSRILWYNPETRPQIMEPDLRYVDSIHHNPTACWLNQAEESTNKRSLPAPSPTYNANLVPSFKGATYPP